MSKFLCLDYHERKDEFVIPRSLQSDLPCLSSHERANYIISVVIGRRNPRDQRRENRGGHGEVIITHVFRSSAILSALFHLHVHMYGMETRSSVNGLITPRYCLHKLQRSKHFDAWEISSVVTLSLSLSLFSVYFTFLSHVLFIPVFSLLSKDTEEARTNSCGL